MIFVMHCNLIDYSKNNKKVEQSLNFILRIGVVLYCDFKPSDTR